jgi:hypothetical protein
VSDVVVRGADVPEALRRDVELWVGCLAGALDEASYRQKLAAAGFERLEIEPTRLYDIEDGRFMSAFIRARKPAKDCCSSTCCA